MLRVRDVKQLNDACQIDFVGKKSDGERIAMLLRAHDGIGIGPVVEAGDGFHITAIGIARSRVLELLTLYIERKNY